MARAMKIYFPGGAVETSGFVESHPNGVTPTTLSAPDTEPAASFEPFPYEDEEPTIPCGFCECSLCVADHPSHILNEKP